MKKVKVRNYFGSEDEISNVRCEFCELDSGDLSFSLIGEVQFLHDTFNTLLLVSTNPQDILKEYDRLKRQLDALPDGMTIDDETQEIFHNHLLEI